ncbi:glycine--tRNA ligase subunit beta [Paucilactobacillus suebicus]|uniref:Glycine--tRNA ligase beta subunit n=1 Tax=Paucilactobacillus suebicus DSM 5007 = KCTC 3549 TaxID=1423807 RepID=A0A0R1WD86_9LACO|nr:glycine--tRNA ligase subunit beta [Paucilactobacillus suebicus]KRM12092.1 glycyl-tRNA synthetase subunit beta [Paucilactobacillus suebicus DSM 5007 = KCTC 3549]
MSHSFLLEIGVEEMPAHVVTPSIQQLTQRVTKYLKEQSISFDQIKPFATPRRLALLLTGVADKQPDIDTEVKGPAKKIAQDADGNWTKAAMGFTRGQGLTVDDITFKDIKGTEYVYVEKHIAGKEVADVLTGLKDIIMAMNFPTMMKWSTNKFEFVRPIKWLVALLDSQVVPFSILNVETGNQTSGHRFLGGDITLDEATDYEDALTKEFVIADQKKRKQLIKEQIDSIAQQNNWEIAIDEDLLEEVNNLVEWPTAFSGHFDEKYLELPDEVLITSMKDHQRFFYARDGEGKLLPNFISVRNGNKDFIDNVIRGNERVLTARLEDARFFYQEDQQVTIDQYVDRLKNVSFHDKISSMYDKMQRVSVLGQMIGTSLHLSDDELNQLKRASQIYKFDLTSGMVGEFAELQGIMGEKYALLQGEPANVATAIREHYMPISADGALPATTIGSVLAVADKLDSIISFFAVDMIPSGSNDPYALRRQAFGIVRIIDDKQWHLSLLNIASEFAVQLAKNDVRPSFDITHNSSEVSDFIKGRLHQLFNGRKVRHDVIDAVLGSSQTDVENIIEAVDAINKHLAEDSFKDSVEALTRVMRIAKKGEFDNQELSVDTQLFENPSEKKLYDSVSELDDNFEKQTVSQQLDGLLSLEPVISAYFDENMIMADNEAVKTNRLQQLSILSKLILKVGNLDELIVK